MPEPTKEKIFSINRNGVLEGSTAPIQELVIPEGVRVIGERAFKNREDLQKVIFPASLERIRTAAFRGCSGLKEIVFSTGLRKMDGSAFRASGLESVQLPEGMEELGPNVFAECQNLTDLELPESLVKIGSDCFAGSGLRRMVIFGTPRLHPGMFADCGPLEYIAAPKLLPAKLPRGPVKDTALVTFVRQVLSGEPPVNQDDYLTYIRNQRRNLFALAVAHEELLQFMFSEKMLNAQDIQSLLELAAENVPVKAALLEYQHQNGGPPDPFAEAEKEFARAERVAAYVEKNGTLPVGELKKIWSWKKREDGTLCITSYKGADTVVTVPAQIGKTPVTAIETTFDSNNHRHIANITAVTLPESLTEIGSYTFFGCNSLQKISIPAGVIKIGDYAFDGCTSLQEISIPDSVEKIGNCAFYSSGLRSVTVPEGVREIGFGAFAVCHDLKMLTLPKSVLIINDICFNSQAVIRAPAGSSAEEYAKNNQIKFQPAKY